MKVTVSIPKSRRRTFEVMIDSFIALSYLVDVRLNKKGVNNVYEIPYENENQKKTILNIERSLN